MVVLLDQSAENTAKNKGGDRGRSGVFGPCKDPRSGVFTIILCEGSSFTRGCVKVNTRFGWSEGDLRGECEDPPSLGRKSKICSPLRVE